VPLLVADLDVPRVATAVVVVAVVAAAENGIVPVAIGIPWTVTLHLASILILEADLPLSLAGELANIGNAPARV
jgi:hypothetical protein